MVIPIYSNRKKAKIRFFTAYAVSVLLVLILFSSFLNPTTGDEESDGTLQSESEDPHSAIYTVLHQRMESLDKICMNVASNRSRRNLARLNDEESTFYASIDSIQKTFVSFSSPEKEKELIALLESFKQAAEKQTNIAKGITTSEDKGLTNSTLKQQLLDKDRNIAELENQNKLLLQEVEAARTAIQESVAITSPTNQQPVVNTGSEWKQRYEILKATNDRLQESNANFENQLNELKKSYKDVVDDNRRLLAQLQAARAGRN
ncbi:hypothetical protein HRH25_18785 [Flavisolibacter sp. BT320]|nr:hypothetical protein [Flavisolibacter longurius]